MWFVVLVVIMNIMLTRTRWGRSVFAVGGNAEAARRSGVHRRYLRELFKKHNIDTAALRARKP